MSINGRKQSEMAIVTELNSSDYLTGYRSGAQGIRISQASLLSWLSGQGLGGGGIPVGPQTSILLLCADDGSAHRLTTVLRDGIYVLQLDQYGDSTGALTSVNLKCMEDNADVLLVVRKLGGQYVLALIPS